MYRGSAYILPGRWIDANDHVHIEIRAVDEEKCPSFCQRLGGVYPLLSFAFDFDTFDSSGHNCLNRPIFTARLLLQRSWWRRRKGHFMHGTKNVEILIIFSDPYQKCLCKPGIFIFLFLPGPSIA